MAPIAPSVRYGTSRQVEKQFAALLRASATPRLLHLLSLYTHLRLLLDLAFLSSLSVLVALGCF